MSKNDMRPPKGSSVSALAELPLEVLEILCQPLTIPERVALTSCCRALWARPDLLVSDVLWGTLHVRSKERELRWKRMRTDINRHWFTASLAAWLSRRQGALRVLRLTGLVTAPTRVLNSLGCSSRLVELRLHENPAVGQEDAGVLNSLSRLGGLTRLQVSWSELPALPPSLSCLTALQDLVLAGSTLGNEGESAWQVVAQLSATLIRLDISACGLPALPAPLSALARLQDLTLAGNEDMGEAGEAAFAPPGSLLSLTHLSLGRCGLLALPPQLSTLTNLAELGLQESYYLAAGGQEDLWPLASLAACLTRLQLDRCSLEGIPAQLCALSALRELSLSLNPLGDGGGATLWRLAELTNLVRLDLRSCMLTHLPTAFVRLGKLQELRLANNRALARGGGAAFQPLQTLRELCYLNVRGCGLRSLPSHLRALSALGVQVDWE